MPPLNPRLSAFEQAVLTKLDTIIEQQTQSGASPVFATIEDHLRYLRVSDMRKYGTVADSENLPPATVDQP